MIKRTVVFQYLDAKNLMKLKDPNGTLDTGVKRTQHTLGGLPQSMFTFHINNPNRRIINRIISL